MGNLLQKDVKSSLNLGVDIFIRKINVYLVNEADVFN